MDALQISAHTLSEGAPAICGKHTVTGISKASQHKCVGRVTLAALVEDSMWGQSFACVAMPNSAEVQAAEHVTIDTAA